MPMTMMPSLAVKRRILTDSSVLICARNKRCGEKRGLAGEGWVSPRSEALDHNTLLVVCAVGITRLGADESDATDRDSPRFRRGVPFVRDSRVGLARQRGRFEWRPASGQAPLANANAKANPTILTTDCVVSRSYLARYCTIITTAMCDSGQLARTSQVGASLPY
jgi:hypothetical protein